jgi:acyl CoA:acetate/3-ketoacid CoA transferase alpha subunit
MGAAFLPVRGILGSVYPEVNDRFKVIPDPFSGEDLVVVRALTPDVTIIHGSRGDEAGNILIPRVSDWALAIRASRTVIATVEERVPGPLTDEADWRLIPGIHLTALVHQFRGAWPGEFPGYYGSDEEHIALYLKSAKDPADWEDYLKKYVFQKD